MHVLNKEDLADKDKQGRDGGDNQNQGCSQNGDGQLIGKTYEGDYGPKYGNPFWR